MRSWIVVFGLLLFAFSACAFAAGAGGGERLACRCPLGSWQAGAPIVVGCWAAPPQVAARCAQRVTQRMSRTLALCSCVSHALAGRCWVMAAIGLLRARCAARPGVRVPLGDLQPVDLMDAIETNYSRWYSWRRLPHPSAGDSRSQSTRVAADKRPTGHLLTPYTDPGSSPWYVLAQIQCSRNRQKAPGGKWASDVRDCTRSTNTALNERET